MGLISEITKSLQKEGKLPELPLKFENESLIKLGISLLIVGILLIIFTKFIK